MEMHDHGGDFHIWKIIDFYLPKFVVGQATMQKSYQYPKNVF